MSNEQQKPEGEVKIPTSEEILNPTSESEDAGGEQPQQGQQHTPDPEELLARQSGWVPEEEWRGDKREWRPAKEFNERGELLTRIKSQSREMQKLKEAMEFLTANQQRSWRAGYDKAIADLKAARTEALEAGDLVKAQDITDKIDDIKDEQKKAVNYNPVQQGPSETFKSWFEKNDWYTKDKVMTRFAEAEGASYKEDHPDSTEGDMLNHVARVIRKQFPDKFAPKGAPSPDGGGRDTSTRKIPSASNSLKTVKDTMTDEQRSIMRTILKTTKMTEEDYLKQFAS